MSIFSREYPLQQNKAKAPAYLALGVLVFVMVIAVGCSGGGPEPTPTATKTAEAPEAQSGGEGEAAVATATPDADTSAADQENDGNSTQTSSAEEELKEDPVTAEIDAEILNVRREPNLSSTILQEARSGEQYEAIGRSQDSQWIYLARDGEAIGWASAEFLTLSADLAALSPVDADDLSAADNQNGDAQTAASQTSSTQTVSSSFAPATMSSPDYGTQAFLWWREEIATRDLQLIREAGFNWVKQTFAWETIEAPSKGQFDWSIADRVVAGVNNNNLKLLARLSADPELTDSFWGGIPPGNGADFANFAFEVASRYNCQPGAVGCIQAYQIWNEPNLSREWGNNSPNPGQYVEFLRLAYAAIKRANPNAIVISAGMAPTGSNDAQAMPDDVFYREMYRAMGGSSNGYFDMLGVHGAGFAAPPELDPAVAAGDQRYGGYRFFAFRHVEDIRQIMVENGDADKRIVLLEFGWTYDSVNPSYKWHGADAGIDAFVQGEYLKGAYEWADANWQPWIGLMSLLTMPNLDWLEDGNPQDEEQFWWAIMDPSPIDQLYFRPAYIKLCNYFNTQKGQSCIYAP